MSTILYRTLVRRPAARLEKLADRFVYFNPAATSRNLATVSSRPNVSEVAVFQTNGWVSYQEAAQEMLSLHRFLATTEELIGLGLANDAWFDTIADLPMRIIGICAPWMEGKGAEFVPVLCLLPRGERAIDICKVHGGPIGNTFLVGPLSSFHLSVWDTSSTFRRMRPGGDADD